MFISSAFLLIFLAALAFSLRMQGSTSTPLISCFNMVVGLFFLYFFLPALLLISLNSGDYIWIPDQGGHENISITIASCIFSLAFFCIGYFSYKPRPSLGQSSNNSIKKSGEAVALTLTVLGLAFKLAALLSSGGIEENILRFSGGLKDTLGIDSADARAIALRNFGGIADAGATWLLLSRMRRKKSVLPVAAIFIITMIATYFGSGKRLYLLWPILAIAIGYHHYTKPITLSKLPIIGISVVAVGFISLMARIYIPANIAGVEIDLKEVDWAQGSLMKFYFLSLEFASFETLTLILNDSENILALFGSAANAFYITNIEPIFYLVPRFIWPAKPDLFLDLSHAYRSMIFGGYLDGQGGGVAATIVGTSWTIGSIIGQMTAMFGLGFFCRSIDKKFRHQSNPDAASVLIFSFAIVAIFHLFRQGTIGWTIIITITQQMGMIIGTLILSLLNKYYSKRRRYTK